MTSKAITGRDVRIALVGCGRISVNHFDAYRKVDGLQLVAVCDVYTWKLLRRDSGLSRRQAATALLELLQPLTQSS